jgi:predicted DNA binding protein
MATVVKGRVPADEFALYQTLSADPDIECEIERIVETGDEVVMPLIWLRGADHETVAAAIADDPSVQDPSLLTELENEHLYRMEWIADIQLVVQMLTGSKATIIDAYGTDGWWYLRVLYPTRDSLSATYDFCEANGLTFEVETIREMDGNPVGRYGLTEKQYEALRLAAERGYFDVPRSVDVNDLADELDISHQALSERLRRAQRVLVEDTLLMGTRSDE